MCHFLDLKKAFDTVDHSILMKKLYHFGIRGNAQNLFANYLSNRKQFVTTHTCKSDKEYITCGIPQGSVLGPTLFLIYINDLPDCHAMQTLLFADDTALLMSGPIILDLHNTINDELKNVQKWFMQNKLTLNSNKTNYLLFHPAKENQSHHFLLNCDGNMLMQTNESKYLGVFIDARLNWKAHILHLTSSVTQSVGVLYKIRHFLSNNLLKILYNALIKSKLSYAITLWASAYKSDLHKLNVLNNRAVRCITFASRHTKPFNAHVSQYVGARFFGYNLPATIARKLFKHSTDAGRLLGSIKKNFF